MTILTPTFKSASDILVRLDRPVNSNFSFGIGIGCNGLDGYDAMD